MDFIDLHCDTATEAMHRSVHLTEPHLHIHLPVTKKIERHCQCFAIYCPDTVRGEDAFNYYTMAKHYFERELERFPRLFEQVRAAGDIDVVDVILIRGENRRGAYRGGRRGAERQT